MLEMIRELYPICRSLTGDGVRETLAILGRSIELEIHEVPTGTPVFDWTVPREWNIRDAWIKNSSGDKIVDFGASNLHVVGYSAPVEAKLSLEELSEHLYSLPEQPDRIPYRTSYYEERWGFCLAHADRMRLEPGEYEVCVDSVLKDGHLTYGECFLPGDEEGEYIIHTHVCHPSMCNDNLSGIAVAARLAEELAAQPRRSSYRFLFVPGTIGAITWLALNEDRLSDVRGGLVISGVGDVGQLTYKRSRSGSGPVDRAAEAALAAWPGGVEVEAFSPYGYDERQYGSPGIDLAVGRLSRTPWGTYPEYHTSADDLDFISAESLADSLAACRAIVRVLETDRTYRNLQPMGEPQLGRRGLYRSLGGDGGKDAELALLWVLNLSDGSVCLTDIAARSGLPFGTVAEAAERLYEADLLEEVTRG